jgi:hypothetical protein
MYPPEMICDVIPIYKCITSAMIKVKNISSGRQANYDLSEKGTSVLGAHLGTFFEISGGVFGETAVL